MGVTFKSNAESNKKVTKKCKAVPVLINLHQPGRLHMKDLVELMGVSRQTIYNWIDAGRFPAPNGYPRPNAPKRRQGCPYWYTATILPLCEKSITDSTTTSQTPNSAS